MDVAHTRQCCQKLELMDAQHDWESALSTQEKHKVLFQVRSGSGNPLLYLLVSPARGAKYRGVDQAAQMYGVL